MTRRVLVTGGLGSLGSAAARELVTRGCAVTVVDNRLARHGANDRNVADLRGRLTVVEGDCRDAGVLRPLVEGVDAVVHAAGHVSHTAGVEDVTPDLEHNVRATLSLLDATRRGSPRARVVLLSTRGVYGSPERLPVDESHPVAPRGMHEWSKLACEEALATFGRLHGLRGTSLRITNTYGPGGQLRSPEFGVVTWWVGQALQNIPIKVFGDGRVRRDLVYSDDVAAAVADAALSEAELPAVMNVGSPAPLSLREIADAIVRAAGQGEVVMAEYTSARKAMEVGDFASDITRIRGALGWSPTTPLDEGMQRTVAYYREHLRDYV